MISFFENLIISIALIYIVLTLIALLAKSFIKRRFSTFFEMYDIHKNSMDFVNKDDYQAHNNKGDNAAEVPKSKNDKKIVGEYIEFEEID